MKIINRPEIIYSVMIIISILSLFARLILLRRLIADFNLWAFFKNIILRIVIVTIILVGVAYYSYSYLTKGVTISQIFVKVTVEELVALIVILLIGMNQFERKSLYKFVRKKIS